MQYFLFYINKLTMTFFSFFFILFFPFSKTTIFCSNCFLPSFIPNLLLVKLTYVNG